MGILKKIRRHAAMAGGNFASMFRELEVPPLPAVAGRLIAEVNRPEPDIDALVRLISSETAMAAKVIQTVNSSLYSLHKPVSSVKHAVMLLGFRQIRSIALVYATMSSLPTPRGGLFDHESFWTDSLLRGMVSRCLSKPGFSDQCEEAFTASLLADVALPVLLRAWGEYYGPIIAEWQGSSKRMCEIERTHFGWDHAQAGAWIAKTWGFPEEMVCYIGAHHFSRGDIQAHQLEDTLVVPISVASALPSIRKPDPHRSSTFFGLALEALSMEREEVLTLLDQIKRGIGEIAVLFGLDSKKAENLLADLAVGACQGGGETQ